MRTYHCIVKLCDDSELSEDIFKVFKEKIT